MIFPILLVLLSGFFHALWNVCTKKSFHKAAFLFSSQVVSFAIFFPIAYHNFLQIDFSLKVYLLFFLSMLAHGTYFILLARLYTIGDLSQVYPIIRGSSLMIIPLFGVMILGEHLSLLGWLGIAIIIGGIFLISEIKLSLLNYRTLSLSLLVGMSIAAYVLIDRLALYHTDPITLNQIGTLGNIIALLPFVLCEKSKNLKQEWALNYKAILIGAVLAPISYMIFLLALEMGAVAVLAPIREFGTVFGSIIGVFFLKEKNGKNRIISSIIIFSGVLLLALSNC